MQTFVDQCVAPVWGTPAKLSFRREDRRGHRSVERQHGGAVKRADLKKLRAAGLH